MNTENVPMLRILSLVEVFICFAQSGYDVYIVYVETIVHPVVLTCSGSLHEKLSSRIMLLNRSYMGYLMLRATTRLKSKAVNSKALIYKIRRIILVYLLIL